MTNENDTTAPKDPALVEVEALDRYGRPILTVGQLRSILEGRDDDEHVVLDDGDGWYVNVARVAVPTLDETGYSDWSAVTLFVGETFDARQI